MEVAELKKELLHGFAKAVYCVLEEFVIKCQAQEAIIIQVRTMYRHRGGIILDINLFYAEREYIALSVI
jgi:hypothetical protein